MYHSMLSTRVFNKWVS